MKMADRLLPSAVRDVEGNADECSRTVSVFNGLAPKIDLFAGGVTEIDALARWMKAALSDGTHPSETGIFVRSRAQLPRA